MGKSGTIWSMIASVISPLLALLGVISCCGLPILAGILATLGIGASQLSFFAEYKGWFIGFAIISLLFGFYQVYFKKETCGCGTNVSETNLKRRSKSKSFQKFFLWLGVAILVLEIKIKQSKAMKVADAARQTHNQCNQKKRNVAEHSHNLNRKKAVVTLHLINK